MAPPSYSMSKMFAKFKRKVSIKNSNPPKIAKKP